MPIIINDFEVQNNGQAPPQTTPPPAAAPPVPAPPPAGKLQRSVKALRGRAARLHAD